jgi:hypothetical protein
MNGRSQADDVIGIASNAETTPMTQSDFAARTSRLRRACAFAVGSELLHHFRLLPPLVLFQIRVLHLNYPYASIATAR